jgi:NAD(P)H-binding
VSASAPSLACWRITTLSSGKSKLRAAPRPVRSHKTSTAPAIPHKKHCYRGSHGREIDKALPRTKALTDLLNKAQPIIEQAQSLYVEAEPPIDQGVKEWQTVEPTAQILIDVTSHHVDKRGSPADAVEAMRAAVDGSIKSVAPDHWINRAMSCVTVFGGTGFLGRRVVHHLRKSGVTVHVASRHPGQTDGDDVKQIAANAHDERTVEAAMAGADGVVNAISLYVETEGKHFIQCTCKRPPGSRAQRGGSGSNG